MKELEQQAVIFRKTINRPLSDFQVRVNEAAVELVRFQPSLVRKRGELLEKARQKVADDGYCFKKGKSRSKVYGVRDAEPAVSKRPKLDQRVREERIKELEEDIADVNSHIVFKEKRRTQAEGARNYKVCDELTEEILECKGRRRDLEKQLKLLLRSEKRSKKRQEKLRSRSKTPMPLTSPQLSSSPLSPLSPRTPSSDSVRSTTPSTRGSITIESSCGESSGNAIVVEANTSAVEYTSMKGELELLLQKGSQSTPPPQIPLPQPGTPLSPQIVSSDKEDIDNLCSTTPTTSSSIIMQSSGGETGGDVASDVDHF